MLGERYGTIEYNKYGKYRSCSVVDVCRKKNQELIFFFGGYRMSYSANRVVNINQVQRVLVGVYGYTEGKNSGSEIFFG